MTTYNTGNPLGSAAAKDLYDNAQNFDHLSNDQVNESWPDRFGKSRLTWHGMEKRYQEKLSSMGWALIDSFQDGARLTRADEALRWKLPDGDGEYYRWDGVLPKDVPAGSTPESTGGIGVGAWLSVGDASLRSDLNRETGASIVGTSSGNTVQEELDKVKLKFASFAAMRASTSSEIGDYALLTGWHADYQGYGSGIFQCVDKTDLTDDGGTIAVSSSYAWIRITGHENVTDFGAVPDAGGIF